MQGSFRENETMRGKKQHAYIRVKHIAIIVAISFIAVLFTGAGSTDKTEKEVQNLFNKRAEIIQNTLLGNIDRESAISLLKEIESGTLYSNDLMAIENYENTDFDRIKDLNIMDISSVQNVGDVATFAVLVEWMYEGSEGIYKEVVEYTIGAEYTGQLRKHGQGEIRLISMDINEVKYVK